MKRVLVFVLLCIVQRLICMAVEITSPNGNMVLNFTLDQGRPTYTLSYKGKEVVRPSHLGLELAKDIVSRHLTSPSMLCLLSLQDWLSIDERLRLPDQNAERINIPANPRHYWRYRMHLTIEQLLRKMTSMKPSRR